MPEGLHSRILLPTMISHRLVSSLTGQAPSARQPGLICPWRLMNSRSSTSGWTSNDPISRSSASERSRRTSPTTTSPPTSRMRCRDSSSASASWTASARLILTKPPTTRRSSRTLRTLISRSSWRSSRTKMTSFNERTAMLSGQVSRW